ncbi:MAG: HD domain-containing protein [Holdemania massiliensis]
MKDRVLTPFELRVGDDGEGAAPYRRMKICPAEKTCRPSYTINTVRTLKKQVPDADFVWIIGDDQYANLDHWKDVDQLRQLVQFAVFSRQGIAVKQPGFLYVENFAHSASSTAVRQGALKDVPKSVRRIIHDSGLYVEEIAKAYCHPRRYQHCVSVSELAVKLAKAHGVNPRKAYIAGMLHDIAKGLDEEAARNWIEVYWPQALDQSWKIWHQYIANWLKTRLYLAIEIIEAVGEHTTEDCCSFQQNYLHAKLSYAVMISAVSWRYA